MRWSGRELHVKTARVNPYRLSNPLKQLKRVAVLLLAVFLTFAPPGTLIFGAILLLWLIEKGLAYLR
jgi:hypothetical protein